MSRLCLDRSKFTLPIKPNNGVIYSLGSGNKPYFTIKQIIKFKQYV